MACHLRTKEKVMGLISSLEEPRRVAYRGDENSLPTFTIKDLFVRYDLYHAIVFPAKPRQLIFSKRMLRSIVSNAFWRSIKIIPMSNTMVRKKGGSKAFYIEWEI